MHELRRIEAGLLGLDQIVLEVRTLHRKCKTIGERALQKPVFVLPIPPRQRVHRQNDRCPETFLFQPLQRPAPLLHDVVEKSDRPLVVADDEFGDALAVSDVRIPDLVELAPMCLECDLSGVFGV